MASPQHSGVHKITDLAVAYEALRPATIEPPTPSGDDTSLPPEKPAITRTPAHPGIEDRPIPAVGDVGAPDLFLNRELTYLNFCLRVLHEAEDERTPLLERLKFIAIVGSNIDEFFMKRIGGLKQQVGAGVHTATPDGRTPQQQIADALKFIAEIEKRRSAVLLGVIPELKKHGVWIASWKELDAAQQSALRDYYLKNIFPLVTPQSMDPAHPFPFVSNLSLNLLLTLHYPDDENELLLARVKVPIGTGIPRFLRVGASGYTYVLLEEVIAANLDLLFPGMTIASCAPFRVTRNASTEQDEQEADDLLELIEIELRERRFAPVVRLQVDSQIAPVLRGKLAAELGLDEAVDVFESATMLGQRDLMEIATLDAPELAHLHDPPHAPVAPPELAPDRSIFHTIRDLKSILVHHPYESFQQSVERFLKEAAADPKVRAIKMTLYRTSKDSDVIKNLIAAARNGKQVAVVLELKAKFDEEANIRWASRMERAGIHVTYGVVGLKTHCKTILVVRQDYDGLRRYAHLATGNYHAGTARLYTDFGLLTCDDGIGRDLTELFNYLTTGFKPRRKYARLLPAPKILKAALLDKIEREIAHQQAGGRGVIQWKMNALEDVDITKALYRASQKGVQIDLIVRDTCRLRPGLPGISDNVRVLSIVGRFLEHARIFYFENGGKPEYYIGSADAMQRNLERRVEVLVPVDDARLQSELRAVLDIQLGDQRSAWEMQSDGSYVQRQGGAARGAQHLLIERAEKRLKEATRLKRRKVKGIAKRKLR
jgi:polyphosphate kinase